MNDRGGRPLRRATQESFCQSCGQPLLFLQTKAGKWMPVDAETVTPGDTQYEPRSGHQNHWQSCPDRDRFRRRGPVDR